VAAHLEGAEHLFRAHDPTIEDGDFTVGVWIHVLSVPDPGNYDTAWALVDDAAGAYAEYIGIYRVSGTNTWRLDIAGVGQSTATTINPGERAYLAYTRQGTTHRFFKNNTQIGTLTGAVSGLTLLEEYLGGDTFNDADLELAHVFTADRRLTTAELLVQQGANAPTIEDTPTSYSTLASNGNDTVGGNHWTPVGSVSFAAAQPGIPGNTSRFTAELIPSLDAGSIQFTRNAHFNGQTYTLWFKYVGQAVENVLGLWVRGNFSTYRPVTTILLAPDGDTGYNLRASKERPMQIAVQSGVTYWIQCNRGTSSNLDPSTLTLDLERFVDEAIPVGAIGVNDEDDEGLPAAFISASQDFHTHRFVQGVANGAYGVGLGNGYVSLEHRFGLGGVGQIRFYDPTMTESFRVDGRPATTGFFNDHGNSVLVKWDAGVIRKYSHLGVLEDTYSVTGGIVNTFGMSPDGTVLYYTIVSSAIVRRWDTVNQLALPDLLTLPHVPSQHAFLVLSDGSFVVLLLTPRQVVRYSDTGVLLNTYQFDPGLPTNFANGLLVRDHNNSDRFLMRDHSTSPPNDFHWITWATGAMDTVVHAEFLGGVYGESDLAATPTPLARFGPANSCPIWVVPGDFVCPPTSPLQIGCWEPHTPDNMRARKTDSGEEDCDPEAAPRAGCWTPHEVDDRRVRLLNNF